MVELPEIKSRMLRIQVEKERHKFSAAHFTVFEDGHAEKLHGHNYAVGVGVEGDTVQNGLLVPFDELKVMIKELCDQWDEFVLLPAVRLL